VTLTLVKLKKTIYTVSVRCWEPRGSETPRSEPKEEVSSLLRQKKNARVLYTPV
jgi:hypothetical protein